MPLKGAILRVKTARTASHLDDTSRDQTSSDILLGPHGVRNPDDAEVIVPPPSSKGRG